MVDFLIFLCRNDYYWEEDHVSSEEEFLHHDIHTIKTIILLTLLPTILLPLLLACICFSHISLLLFLLKFKFLPIPVIVRQPPQPTGGCGNLLIRQVSANWQDSYNYCQTQGGSLVTVESQFKYDCILAEIRESGLPDDIVYWTSGTDAASEGNFVWETTGLPVTQFYPVGNNQPDNGAGGIVENCIGLRKIYPPNPVLPAHEMNDEQCALLYYSICDVS
ncbi:uncharacterized protein LOC110863619 isoform X2 [Folsomia candida]|uniref:uncharacterized protein LOC110863619 isoform X2 n=1 Tax=Folsomia candida TaxID=158441 RepID=UPI00160502EA|nr:uncharacterized protein LOC110863619 isoform X2 [Folsomia candida]